MAEIVYVVLSELGEYSDREVWVSGVYRSKDEAEAAITKCMAARREWEMWDWNRSGFLRETKEVGPEPEKVRTEWCNIYAIPIGQWVEADLET